jgi:hypothetical protein
MAGGSSFAVTPLKKSGKTKSNMFELHQSQVPTGTHFHGVVRLSTLWAVIFCRCTTRTLGSYMVWSGGKVRGVEEKNENFWMR